MSHSNDPNVMARFPRQHVDALLDGAPVDAGDSRARVAHLLWSLRTAGRTDEVASEREIVAAMAEAIRSGPVSVDVRRKRMFSKTISAKAAAIGVALALAGATAAAAATGSLPDAAQRAISRAFAHVHVSVPNPDDHAGAHGGAAHGPDAAAAAKFGLCTAAGAGPSTTVARGDAGSAVAFTNLQKAANGAGLSVVDYCKDAVPPTSDAVGAPGAANVHAPSTTLPAQAVTPPGPPTSLGARPTVPPVVAPITAPPITAPPVTTPPASTPPTIKPPVTTPGPPVSAPVPTTVAHGRP